MSLPLHARPAAKLLSRLALYVRPKCHPLLLDTRLNSPATVRVNIYQAFTLAAMKFHLYLAALPRGAARDARHAVAAIASVLSAMAHGFVRIWRRLDAESRQQRQPQGSAGSQQRAAPAAAPPRISACHIHWLGLHAFRAVLSRKRVAYRGSLLPWLNQALAARRYAPLSAQLAAVVDPQRHTFLRRVKF
mmetsp:Transcript_43236/g.112063  ORF Transcript_43236/g.112063 Transcript_43236/m.112063 type:complete len:190 (-) Transcript_43236:432-1001(-)